MFKRLIILFGISLSSAAFSATVDVASPHAGWLFGLSAGPTWVTGNQKQTINLQPDVTKTYTANNNSDAFPTVELFFGWQRAFLAPLIAQSIVGQLGVNVIGAGNATLTGDIWEDGDPSFDNFNYSYKVNHTQVGVKGRLVGMNHHFAQPYISGSIGVGFNRAYDFTATPKIAQAVAAPGFASNTTTTFTYTLGIGLQKAITERVQAAIGYEFSDWGNINLGSASGQTTNKGLTLNHLYANQLQLSLFYTG